MLDFIFCNVEIPTVNPPKIPLIPVAINMIWNGGGSLTILQQIPSHTVTLSYELTALLNFPMACNNPVMV